MDEDQMVKAMTFADDDRELPPREVKGKLTSREVPTLGYTQFFVDGDQVDPETIEEQ
jgi:hypothetical protein